MKSRVLLTLLLPAFAVAQGSEDFRAEISAYAWRTSVQGTLQSGILPVNLRNDLNLAHRTAFFGRLVLKPGPRHRIVVEGAPYRFGGSATLSRTITFNNRTYSFRDAVSSTANLTYLYGGYQFDVATGNRGHAGLQFGAAYLDASGTLSSGLTGIAAGAGRRIGIPLAGVSFRTWIVPSVLSVSGDVKGMDLRRYGHFVQAGIRGGAGWRSFTFEAGYQFLDADIHEAGGSSDPVGIAPRIRGPIFGIQFRK